MMSTMLVLYGIATVYMEPELLIKHGVVTFLGGLETVEHWNLPNIWVGPPAKSIIGIAICKEFMFKIYLKLTLFFYYFLFGH